MRSADTYILISRFRKALVERIAISETFFESEAPRLSEACHEMSRRFLSGGRLLAFGRGASATDAEHVSVEFVHPVIVGKRALPALDLGPDFERRLPVILGPEDMVMGFASPEADPAVERTVSAAREAGAMTFSLTGEAGEHSFAPPDGDPFAVQEVFEVLYHVLWETVHVFFEHREQGHDVGHSSFLYPFLGKDQQPLEAVVHEVQGSMLRKMAETNRLRALAAETEADNICGAARGISERLRRGGKLVAFGNGGSATDANDLVIDCLDPPPGMKPVPAVSLSAEPANITAIANDIGTGAVFARQLIAHAREQDVAVAFSTSGGSKNILAALAEARGRGLLTVAVLGYDGGRIVAEDLADHAIVVRSDYIPRIQEVQASIYHVMRGLIDDLLKETP